MKHMKELSPCFYPGHLLPGEFLISRVLRPPGERPDLQCSDINLKRLWQKSKWTKLLVCFTNEPDYQKLC